MKCTSLPSSLCFWLLSRSAIRRMRRRARMHRFHIGLPPLQSKGRRNQFISRNSPAKMEAVSKSWLTGAHPCTSSSMGMEYGAPESSRPWRLITGGRQIVFAAADLADVGLLLSRPFRRPRRSGRIADPWLNQNPASPWPLRTHWRKRRRAIPGQEAGSRSRAGSGASRTSARPAHTSRKHSTNLSSGANRESRSGRRSVVSARDHAGGGECIGLPAH